MRLERTLQIRGNCRSEDTADQKTLQIRGHCRSEVTSGQRTLQIRGHFRLEDTADERTLQMRGHYRSEDTADQRSPEIKGHFRSEDAADQRTLQIRWLRIRWLRWLSESEVTADHRSLQWLAGDRSCTQKYETYRKYLVDPRLGVYLELFLINAWWSSRGIPWLISNEFSGSI